MITRLKSVLTSSRRKGTLRAEIAAALGLASAVLREAFGSIARLAVALTSMPLLLAALTPGTAVAAEPNLLERCFAPAALAARPGERTPMRGAPGHSQRIPPLPAHASQMVPVPRGAIRRVNLPPRQKLVALTIDLCEQNGEISGYDGDVFDYLRANRIKATVFAGGKWMMTHPERTRQLIADPLLEIGSHGWAHRNVRGLAGNDLAQEMRGPEAAFHVQRTALATSQCVAATPGAANALQPRIGLTRFPFGACNAPALDLAAASGLLPIQWDVSTGDPGRSQSAEAIARIMREAVRPGSIVLIHANGRGHNTAAALPLAIPALQSKGYRFVTVSELLAAGKPVVTDTCYDSRPGDTDRYDFLFVLRR